MYVILCYLNPLVPQHFEKVEHVDTFDGAYFSVEWIERHHEATAFGMFLTKGAKPFQVAWFHFFCRLDFNGDTGIADAFADVESLFARCRFSDCRHDTEPGCAVKAALASGELSRERWTAYSRLKSELAREETARAESSHRYRK